MKIFHFCCHGIWLIKAVVIGTRDAVAAKMENLRVADAITEIFNLFKRCNKYIDETMPWALAKDEAKKDRLAEVLYNLVEGISVELLCWSPLCRRLQRRFWLS